MKDNILPIGLLLIALFLVYKLVSAFRNPFADTPEEIAEKKAEAKKAREINDKWQYAFNTKTFKSYIGNKNLISESEAKNKASLINGALGFFSEDENAIISTIESLPNLESLSRVAFEFSLIDNQNLSTILESKFSGYWDYDKYGRALNETVLNLKPL